MLPPTAYLPPIKNIGNYSLQTLNDALHYLRRIYNPEVRGSRRRRQHQNALAATDTNTVLSESRLELDTLRTDRFERTYAIKWLTALISQLGNFQNPDLADSSPTIHQSMPEDFVLQNAASLLAICAGTASAGVIARQFVFESLSDSFKIKVELMDVPLDNRDYGSVGAQTWGGACIMAEMIVDHPTQFGFHQFEHHHQHPSPPTPFRCLELGAGTGLVSITITKMMQKSIETSTTELEVVATDYYPSVLANLERNVNSNFPSESSSSLSSPSTSVRILTRALDWSTFSSETTHEPVFETPFDLILGADIVYESQHALWIKSCLTKLLRKPYSSSPSSSTTSINISPTFHLVIPLRSTHTLESNTIEQAFPFNDSNASTTTTTELVIHHKEIITCDAESGREGEDVEYAYYKIGWAVPC